MAHKVFNGGRNVLYYVITNKFPVNYFTWLSSNFDMYLVISAEN